MSTYSHVVFATTASESDPSSSETLPQHIQNAIRTCKAMSPRKPEKKALGRSGVGNIHRQRHVLNIEEHQLTALATQGRLNVAGSTLPSRPNRPL
jgi:hypothetical protein